MKENEKLKGLEVHNELMKVLKNLKQGSVFQSKEFRIKTVIEKSHLELKEHVKKNMISSLREKIYEKYKDSFIEKEGFDNNIDLELSLFIIDSSELKHIVDYCVRNMPLSAIEEIRK